MSRLKMALPPTPWIVRPMTIDELLLADPQMALPIAKITMAAIKFDFLPNTSASPPKTGTAVGVSATANEASDACLRKAVDDRA